MPPSVPNHLKRITANPVRPARHRPGKAVPEDESSEEDEDDEVAAPSRPAPKPQSQRRPQKAQAIAHQEDDDEDDDEEGFVTDEEDTTPIIPSTKASAAQKLTASSQVLGQLRSAPAPSIAAPVLDNAKSEDTSDEEEDEEDNDEDEDDSEEEEEASSEDDIPQRKLQRPTFIRKADRAKLEDASNVNLSADNAVNSTVTEASSTPDIDEQTRRLAQADLYIRDKLERDALARSQGRKAWDDDEEMAPEDAVDDTDGVDPEAEHAAWRLREFRRLKRDREAIEAREKEIEELERRRNLTQEERDAEDHERLAKQDEERKQSRGQSTYLAKYHHKGAFFQGDEAAELLHKRDIMGAKFEDEVSDKSTLPEYMRIRDMTKLGRKGRTKYRDLRSEDTSRLGQPAAAAGRRWGSGFGAEGRDGGSINGMGMDLRGVDERFLPDRDRPHNHPGPTGANASTLVPRKERRRHSRSRSRSRSQSPPSYRARDRDRHDTNSKKETYFREPDQRSERRRHHARSRSRSRSRSETPPRRRRKRTPSSSSPLSVDADRDKRRRVAV